MISEHTPTSKTCIHHDMLFTIINANVSSTLCIQMQFTTRRSQHQDPCWQCFVVPCNLPWPQNKWVSRTDCGTFQCQVWWSELHGFLRHHVENRQRNTPPKTLPTQLPSTLVNRQQALIPQRDKATCLVKQKILSTAVQLFAKSNVKGLH